MYTHWILYANCTIHSQADKFRLIDLEIHYGSNKNFQGHKIDLYVIASRLDNTCELYNTWPGRLTTINRVRNCFWIDSGSYKYSLGHKTSTYQISSRLENTREFYTHRIRECELYNTWPGRRTSINRVKNLSVLFGIINILWAKK